MPEEALLLTADESSTDDERAQRLLQFFGVPFQRKRMQDVVSLSEGLVKSDKSYRLVCAARNFLSVMNELGSASHPTNGFGRYIHSVFLYSESDTATSADVASQLCKETISVSKAAENETEWRIANDPDGMCGPMRGLHIRPAVAALKSCEFFVANDTSSSALIGAENKASFLKLTWNDVPVFVSSTRLIDIDAELTTHNFDIRDHVFSAVPFVAYIRWGFPHSSWNAPEASACLVIDDPLLKARYGFLHFRELLAVMRQARFSTSIAFIPWNWRRSDPKVVELFKANPANYSLCIHGCDHTAGEFGIFNQKELRAIACEAVRRMSLHRQRTGLTHDSVMVFPQGIFSEQALVELKRASFNAVVNTEVHSNLMGKNKLRISDVWDVAVMSYADFPIYTRRYPAQGVSNLAFDLLLGKPCLVVVHHDFFTNGYTGLTEFVGQLNALKTSLTWRSLGDVVRRGYRQKQASSDRVEIEMYGSELLVENRFDRAMNYFIHRRERDPNSIESVFAGSRRVPWNSGGDRIEFNIDVAPGESTLLRVVFKPAEHVVQGRQNLAYSAKIVLRRYLSEARDNYIMPVKARMAAFSRS